MCARFGEACVLLWCVLAIRASAHSFLLAPKGDWKSQIRPECRLGATVGHGEPYEDCNGPCGVDPNFFDLNQAPITFSRGQYVNMQWAKNNHFSGFVRFTLVPKHSRLDFSSHDNFAFRYACWEAGKAPCSYGEFCGTDMEGQKYTADVQIPPVYPDGEYVLGWSWYGGSKLFSSDELKNTYGITGESGQRSEFGDYYSCVNVIIKGGMEIQDEYTPIFQTGQADRTGSLGGTCASAVNKLGICKVEPCSGKYPVTNMVPAEFDGRSPPPIKSSYLERKVTGTSKLGSRDGTSVEPTPRLNSNNSSRPGANTVDQPAATSSPYYDASSSSQNQGNGGNQGSSSQSGNYQGTSSQNGGNGDNQGASFQNGNNQGSSPQNGNNQGSSSRNGNSQGSSAQNEGKNGSSSSVDFASFDFIRTSDQTVLYSTNANSGAYVTLTINRNELVTMRANTIGSVRNVQFVAKLKNNQATVMNHVQETPPYFIVGDDNGRGIAWQNVPVDNWIDLSVTVTSTSGNQNTRQLFWYLDTSRSG